MAIAGVFGEFDLAGILQMLQGQRASGRLVLNHAGVQGELALSNGQVFDAQCGNVGINGMCFRYLTAKGAEIKPSWIRQASRSGAGLIAMAKETKALQADEALALHRMLLLDLATQLFDWEKAEFRFVPEIPQVFAVAVGIDELTLEAMRRADEFPIFRHDLAGATVLDRKVDLERFPVKEGDVPLHHPARHVLEMVDGVSTVEDFLLRTWLSPFRLWEALHHLRLRDWIEEVDHASVHESVEEVGSGRSSLWRAAALFAGVSITSLVVALAMRERPIAAFLGSGNPLAKARLEVRARPHNTWQRVLTGRPPASAVLPDSYTSGP
jgi:hypothetical protein